MPPRWRALPNSRIADCARGNQPIPDKQNKKCADDRANESRALIGAIPADGLADERRQ
jgi:hypothetical protein